jgi:ElaB/YqjD/DUF883 family membrane-anchored ribosome-binding protein
MATPTKILQDAIKSNGTRTTSEDVEERIEELRNEIAALTKTLASFGATKVDDYKAGLDRLAADAIATSARAFEAARSEAVSLEGELENQIRARPLQAVGIAVGIGFLAALLTRRG